MELLDIVDKDNNLTGEIVDREIVHETGLFHREVAVIIINENNEVLLEKRAPSKKQSSNKWVLCAGHIEAGDKPENAIIREIKEEIGLDLQIKDLEFLKICKRCRKFNCNQYNNAYMYVYMYKTKRKLSEYIIQKEEVSEVKYFDLIELEKQIKNGNEEFAFTKEEYIIEIINIVKNKIVY